MRRFLAKVVQQLPLACCAIERGHQIQWHGAEILARQHRRKGLFLVAWLTEAQDDVTINRNDLRVPDVYQALINPDHGVFHF